MTADTDNWNVGQPYPRPRHDGENSGVEAYDDHVPVLVLDA